MTYRFYTDLVEKNKMDTTPFFEFKLSEIKDVEIAELRKFHKSYFDVENITNTASELKYLNELKNILTKEMNTPSENFVAFFTKQVYPGVMTAKIKEQFLPIVKRSFTQLINDTINERLKSALNQEKEKDAQEAIKIDVTQDNTTTNIVTTEEELEGFYIVKSILRQIVDAKRITYRDAQSYFAILLDDNNRKTICRLYLNAKKVLVVLDENKKEIKYEISGIDEIFKHSEVLIKTTEKLSGK